MDRFKGDKGAAGVRSFAKSMLRATTVASVTSLAFATLNPAMAQTGPSEEDQRNDKVVVEGLQDREIQTSKITAPLADTPKSITVIPAEIIEAIGAVTLTDALRTIPGITLGSGEGGTSAGDRPFIRGVDSTNDVFVDGVRDAASRRAKCSTWSRSKSRADRAALSRGAAPPVAASTLSPSNHALKSSRRAALAWVLTRRSASPQTSITCWAILQRSA
ncbi:MAG: TonB-dependent receptor plug domain-containing protein [Hyphomonadaceae bacterium]